MKIGAFIYNYKEFKCGIILNIKGKKKDFKIKIKCPDSDNFYNCESTFFNYHYYQLDQINKIEKMNKKKIKKEA